ncbi:hypothetical protein EMIHUDRAFT_110035 [Emiliania huxleyi CCMP1516]|uniref:AP2/ERF domain-containing protein n=2 Tax=Emiliania huxleyi TaxID=2903 RepID=A0A0D3KMN4_EMIH1|nr:hypothetical protein EMIHUDRAFT_110035 [Emiliania huxleyi CCMP1516]EOD37019.1 hypothetical protein EMIHUDRAFT_110035 [Emiliania huxleyi CCMP1516]|eukprot:XP_005789448.1 hypothetical protein EMIHUDRAFT_110035 [Emiliania huxleyi CCMP1516]
MASHNGLQCWMCLGGATHACPRCDVAYGTAVCLTCFEKAARQADTKRKLGRLRHDALDWTGAPRGERPLRPVDMATTPASPCQCCTRECLQPQLVLLPAPAPPLAAGPGGQQAPPVPVPAVEAAAATAAPATPVELAPLPAEAASPPAGGAAAPSAGSASWITFLGTASAWVGGALLEAAAEGFRRAKRRRCDGEQREGRGGEEEEEAPRVGASERARLGGPSADEAGGGGAPPAAPAAQAAVRTITAAGAEAVRQADREGLTLATGCGNTGYKGVCYRPKERGSKKYRLSVFVGGKMLSLGYFTTPEEAALFYARREAGRDMVAPASQRMYLRRAGSLEATTGEATTGAGAAPTGGAPAGTAMPIEDLAGAVARGAAGAAATGAARMMAPPRTASSEGVVLIPAVRKDSTTGYKNVIFHRGSKQFEAKVRPGGKSVFLGSFDTAEEAATAYARSEYGRADAAKLLQPRAGTGTASAAPAGAGAATGAGAAPAARQAIANFAAAL